MLTCYVLSVTTTFAARNEDNITLASVGVLILEKEEFVNAVILQCRDLNNDSDRASETLLDHEVLLPSHLGTVNQCCFWQPAIDDSSYALEKVE